MLPISVVAAKKQSLGWQTCAVGDATPYGVDEKPLAQQT